MTRYCVAVRSNKWYESEISFCWRFNHLKSLWHPTDFIDGLSTIGPILFDVKLQLLERLNEDIFESMSHHIWIWLWKDTLYQPSPLKELQSLNRKINGMKWDERDLLNAKTMNSFVCALRSVEFKRVAMWNSLRNLRLFRNDSLGANEVKESKSNLLTHQYELLKMDSDEIIKDIFSGLLTL